MGPQRAQNRKIQTERFDVEWSFPVGGHHLLFWRPFKLVELSKYSIFGVEIYQLAMKETKRVQRFCLSAKISRNNSG